MIRSLARVGLIAVLFGACGVVRAAGGADVLAKIEARVRQIDSLNRSLNGTFQQEVLAESAFGKDTSRLGQRIRVTVRDGMQDERVLLTGDSVVRTPPNAISVLSLQGLVLPYLSRSNAGAPEELSGSILRDTAIDGVPCVIVWFQYKRTGDSTVARGAGRLIVSKEDWTPFRCSYDVRGEHPRRGSFFTNIAVDLLRWPAAVAIRRTFIDVRFEVAGEDVGHTRTVVSNGDFSLSAGHGETQH